MHVTDLLDVNLVALEADDIVTCLLSVQAPEPVAAVARPPVAIPSAGTSARDQFRVSPSGPASRALASHRRSGAGASAVRPVADPTYAYQPRSGRRVEVAGAVLSGELS